MDISYWAIWCLKYKNIFFRVESYKSNPYSIKQNIQVYLKQVDGIIVNVVSRPQREPGWLYLSLVSTKPNQSSLWDAEELLFSPLYLLCILVLNRMVTGCSTNQENHWALASSKPAVRDAVTPLKSKIGTTNNPITYNPDSFVSLLVSQGDCKPIWSHQFLTFPLAYFY